MSTTPEQGNFVKKPVTVFAARWFKNGDHPEDDCFRPYEDSGKIPTEPREGAVVRYFRHPQVDGRSTCRHCGGLHHDHGFIDTLEGGHIVCPGDYIITGVKGERYPCKPDIFEATYSREPENKGQISDGYHTFDELYEHRHALFMALVKTLPKKAWMSPRHADGSVFEGWFIAGIDLPTGTISYHLPDRLRGHVRAAGANILANAPEWDGHTSKDVIGRLQNFATFRS